MPTVRREIVLPVPRDRAWELLTDPAELERWLADEVELEAEPGGQVRARWRDGRARAGVVDDVVPAESIDFRWWDEAPEGARGESEVQWRLDEVRDGTRLVVLERRLAAGPVAAGRLGAGPVAAGPVAAGRVPWAPRLLALASLAVAVPA